MAGMNLNGSDWQFKGFVGEDWLLRKAHLPETGDTRGWHPASVPGSVQQDAWQAGLIPDPYHAMNSLSIEWISDRTWLYKKQFIVPIELRGKHQELVFQGVDYAARYYLNGDLIGRSEGMFLPVRFDVTAKLKYGEENFLCVVIDPAPFEQPQIGYTSRVMTQKTRMNYWWDFCPRMVHLGIWQGVALVSTGPVRFENVGVRPVLSDDHASAVVYVTARMEGSEVGSIHIALSTEADPSKVQTQAVSFEAGQSHVQVEFQINQPDVWWPNGSGSQPLYRAVLKVFTVQGLSDEREETFGIRTISFVDNDDASPDALPYTLTVNGKKIYINGWNWVPMDVLYGAAQPEKRERLLRLAKQAHVNMLRVWGGGLIEQPEFYDLCDRLGILIWQEFIQSSSGIDNFPAKDPEFIGFLVRNGESAILGRRNHPSLAAWCGGNELHYAGDDLCDSNHPALAALLETVRLLDPDRQWFPTSPSGGLFGFRIPDSQETAERLHDVHGPWEYQGLQAQYQLYNQGQSLLHSEFGVEGLTNQPALDAVIPAEQQWPVSLDNPIWMHLGAWWVKSRLWEEAWGALADLQAVQRATQYLQADGLRYAVEADRRRQYHNSGTLPWQFNEPYPMAACTSAVDYYAEPKPVYYAVRRAYRPLTVTAVFGSLVWKGRDVFQTQIWCSNTGTSSRALLSVRVLSPRSDVFYENQIAVNIPANGSLKLDDFELPLAQIPGPFFILDLALKGDDGQLTADNRYLFCTTENLAPLLAAAPAQVQAGLEKDGGDWLVRVVNHSDQTALNIWLAAVKQDLSSYQYVYFSDSYFSLLPGEEREISVSWVSAYGPGKIQLTGWNIPGQLLG